MRGIWAEPLCPLVARMGVAACPAGKALPPLRLWRAGCRTPPSTATGKLGARPGQPETELGSQSPGSATQCDPGESLPLSGPQFPCLGSGEKRRGPPRAPGTHRGVGPPTHAAAVGLGVLDGVGREVDLQGRGVRVGPVAVGTLVGLVLVVLALVRLGGGTAGVRGQARLPQPHPGSGSPCRGRQLCTHLEVGELSESLFAARMWALVGSVACVDSARGGEVESLADSAGPLPPPPSRWMACNVCPAPRPPCSTPYAPQRAPGKSTPFFLLWPLAAARGLLSPAGPC